MAKKRPMDLVPLTTADYLGLDYGDVVYDELDRRWVVKAINIPAGKPRDRVISLKYGLWDWVTLVVRDGKPDVHFYKHKGVKYRMQTLAIPKLKLYRGQRVIAKSDIFSMGPSLREGKKVSRGTRGTIPEIRKVNPQYFKGQSYALVVKWAKGGTFYNVLPTEVEPVKIGGRR